MKTTIRTRKNTDKQSEKNGQYRGLVSWKKGQSGNPKGRPPLGKSISEMLRRIQDDPVDEWTLASLHRKYGPHHNPQTMREAILLAAVKDAMRGDERAREFVAERTEGKVPQSNINLNANQDTDDLTKMPLGDLLKLAQQIKEGD